jgi:hypothetical protein
LLLVSMANSKSSFPAMPPMAAPTPKKVLVRRLIPGELRRMSNMDVDAMARTVHPERKLMVASG